MDKVAIITRRELAACFFSWVAYVVGGLFLAATGAWFIWRILVPGNEATIRPLLESMAAILIFFVPLLTMRSLADEYATGTIETLMTAPVTDTQVVIGKFFGVWLFYCVLLAGTLLHTVLVYVFGQPETGVVLFGYAGMLLLGLFYVAVGLFASACTRHQLLAAVLGIAILAAMPIGARLAGLILGDAGRHLAGYLDALGHFEAFSKGVVDSRGVVFFVSATVLFLFLAVKVLESRRWR